MNQSIKSDQSFDFIVDKFEKNIYGTTKGKMRQALWNYHLHQSLDLNSTPLRIFDAGGGTGMMAANLLVQQPNHQITINDISIDALEVAKARLQEYQHVDYIPGEVQAISDANGFDLVICHAVLEWLQQPLGLIPHLLSLIKPGGYLSLSFFNKDAKRFGNILYGNFDYVHQGMQVKNQVRMNPNNAVTPAEVIDTLQHHNMTIIRQAGIRCFHDYVRDRSQQISEFDTLLALEKEYGTQHPYLWLGKYFHIIAQKPDL